MSIKVQCVDGLVELGGDFAESLARVKAVEGRKFDGRSKIWSIPITKEEFGFDEEQEIETEIDHIEDVQKSILENEAYIEEVVSELSARIDKFSFRSKSYVKGAMVRDRALLQHSLDNARIPVDNLTELQVRGMSSALRLIDGGYNYPR